jgi:hypothetical protein
MIPPKIQYIKAIEHYRLLAIFESGEVKLFSLLPKLNKAPYDELKNIDFFEKVRLEIGGRGVSWNDDIDLSENEIWQNGILLTTLNEIVARAEAVG